MVKVECTEQQANVPDGYDEDKADVGRPKDKTRRNKQDSNFGKDRLGAKGMKKDYNDNNSLKTNFKGGSPLALENLTALKHKDMLKKIPLDEEKFNK